MESEELFVNVCVKKSLENKSFGRILLDSSQTCDFWDFPTATPNEKHRNCILINDLGCCISSHFIEEKLDILCVEGLCCCVHRMGWTGHMETEVKGYLAT